MPHKEGHKEWTLEEKREFNRTHSISSDANPNDLTFDEWFAAERRNNPGKKVGTWRGKQYALTTKQEQTEKKKGGGRLYKSGGRVRDAFTEQYD
jgi:hypothetical protein